MERLDEVAGAFVVQGERFGVAALGSLAFGLISAPVAGWRNAMVLVSFSQACCS